VAAISPTKTIAKAPSLRDKHKSQTARALRDASLKLFATQGYDATTTEEIAEKAGVSARTFFRYFPTKESLLYIGELDWIQSFAEGLAGQPKSMRDLEAIRATIVEITPRVARRRQSLLLFNRAIASSRTLRGLDHDHMQENTAIFAKAIAARRRQRSPDEAAKLLASITLLAYRRALEVWLEGPSSVELADTVEKEFKVLSQLFAD
jgi:AcrR family transcriptional regulator